MAKGTASIKNVDQMVMKAKDFSKGFYITSKEIFAAIIKEVHIYENIISTYICRSSEDFKKDDNCCCFALTDENRLIYATNSSYVHYEDLNRIDKKKCSLTKMVQKGFFSDRTIHMFKIGILEAYGVEEFDKVFNEIFRHKEKYQKQEPPKEEPKSARASKNLDDVIEQLNKLKALLDSGAITQEEFVALKKKYL